MPVDRDKPSTELLNEVIQGLRRVHVEAADDRTGVFVQPRHILREPVGIGREAHEDIVRATLLDVRHPRMNNVSCTEEKGERAIPLKALGHGRNTFQCSHIIHYHRVGDLMARGVHDGTVYWLAG